MVRAFAADRSEEARPTRRAHQQCRDDGRQRTTGDGFEDALAVNHLGPFLLTNLLTPLLVDSAGPSHHRQQ
ncbi:MAG: hypothetical protein R2710_08065 [Acidimicrobiales bacterium]